LTNRLPSICEVSLFADAGALMACVQSFIGLYQRTPAASMARAARTFAAKPVSYDP
jgi:hypothetical protein